MASVEEVEEDDEEEDDDESVSKRADDGEELLEFDPVKCECVQVTEEVTADRHAPELHDLVKKYETKLEPIDQQLLELGPFAKERHDVVPHDWPLQLELHAAQRKRRTYSPTGRGGRRTKSSDEPSPLAIMSPREPVKRTRKRRSQKDVETPLWPSEHVTFPVSETMPPVTAPYPMVYGPVSIGEPSSSTSTVTQRDMRYPAILTSSSQESTAAEAMLALSASHPPANADPCHTRSPDSCYSHSLMSDDHTVVSAHDSAEQTSLAPPLQMVTPTVDSEARSQRQSFTELHPPVSTSSLVSECHRAGSSLSLHSSSDSRHEHLVPRPPASLEERDSSSPVTHGYVAPQVLVPGKHKYPNMPQLSRLPDANQIAMDGRRRLSGGSVGQLPGAGHVVEDLRAQRFSSSATPPPMISDERKVSTDARFGPANPFWPIPPTQLQQQQQQQQQQLQQQQVDVSQPSLPPNYSLPFMAAGWPGTATAFRTPFLPSLSSFPRTSVITALDLSSPISSSSPSPSSYRHMLPPYYFLTPQYQLAAAAAVGMKSPFVNSPIPSTSPSSSLAGGLSFPATSPNPPSSHLSAFKTLQNARSFTPPALHPLSSTNRDEKTPLDSPVPVNKWPTIIGSQLPAGASLFAPSTYALGAQAALVPQMNLISGTATLPQAHLPPGPNDQLQMRESPPITTRRSRGRRSNHGSAEAAPSPNFEHTQRGVEQNQLHESLEAEYARWRRSQQQQQDNTKHAKASTTPSSTSPVSLDGGQGQPASQTVPLGYVASSGSPNKNEGERQRAGKEVIGRGGRQELQTSPEKMKLKIHEPMNNDDFRAQEKGVDRRRRRRNWRKKDEKEEPVRPEVVQPLSNQLQNTATMIESIERHSPSFNQPDHDPIIDITTVDDGTPLSNPLQEELRANSSLPPFHPSSIYTAPVSSTTPLLSQEHQDPALLQPREPSPVTLSSANMLLLFSKGQTTTAGQFNSSHLPLTAAAAGKEDDASSEETMSASPSSPKSGTMEDMNTLQEETFEEPSPHDLSETTISTDTSASQLIPSPYKDEMRSEDGLAPANVQESPPSALQERKTRSDSFSAAETMLLIAQGEEEDGGFDEQDTSGDKMGSPVTTTTTAAAEETKEMVDLGQEEEEDVAKDVLETTPNENAALPSASSPVVSSCSTPLSPPPPLVLPSQSYQPADLSADRESTPLQDEPEREQPRETSDKSTPGVGYQFDDTSDKEGEDDILTMYAEEAATPVAACTAMHTSPVSTDVGRVPILSSQSSTASLIIDEAVGSDTSPPAEKKLRLHDVEKEEEEEEEGEIQEDEKTTISTDSASIAVEEKSKPVGRLPSWSEFAAATQLSCSTSTTQSMLPASNVSSKLSSVDSHVSHKKSIVERLPQQKKHPSEISDKLKAGITSQHQHAGRVSKHSHSSASKICSKLEKRLSAMVSKQVGSSSSRTKSSTTKERRSHSSEREIAVSSSTGAPTSDSKHSKPVHSDHQLAVPPRDPQWRHSNSREGTLSRGHTPTHQSSDESSCSRTSHDRDRGGKKGHSFYTNSPERHLSPPSSSSHRHHHNKHRPSSHTHSHNRSHDDHRDNRHHKSSSADSATSSSLSHDSSNAADAHKSRSHQSSTRDDHSGWSRSNHRHHHHKHRHHDSAVSDGVPDAPSRGGSCGRDGETIVDDHSEPMRRARRLEDFGSADEEDRHMKRAKHKHHHHHQVKHHWRDGDSRSDHDHRGMSREDKHRHRSKHSNPS